MIDQACLAELRKFGHGEAGKPEPAVLIAYAVPVAALGFVGSLFGQPRAGLPSRYGASYCDERTEEDARVEQSPSSRVAPPQDADSRADGWMRLCKRLCARLGGQAWRVENKAGKLKWVYRINR
jgi:hypothetical protein